MQRKLHEQMYPLPLSNDLKIIPFQKVDVERVTWAGRAGTFMCVCQNIISRMLVNTWHPYF